MRIRAKKGQLRFGRPAPESLATLNATIAKRLQKLRPLNMKVLSQPEKRELRGIELFEEFAKYEDVTDAKNRAELEKQFMQNSIIEVKNLSKVFLVTFSIILPRVINPKSE